MYEASTVVTAKEVAPKTRTSNLVQTTSYAREVAPERTKIE
jgi:hypothetical protein